MLGWKITTKAEEITTPSTTISRIIDVISGIYLQTIWCSLTYLRFFNFQYYRKTEQKHINNNFTTR